LVVLAVLLLATPLLAGQVLAEPLSLELRRAAGGAPPPAELTRLIPYGLGIVGGASFEGSLPAGREAERNAVAGVDAGFFGFTLRDERHLLLVAPESISRAGVSRPAAENVREVRAENSDVGVRAVGQARSGPVQVAYLLRFGRAPAFEIGLDWLAGRGQVGLEYGYRRNLGAVRLETDRRPVDLSLLLDRHRYEVRAGIEPVRLSLSYASAGLGNWDQEFDITASARTGGITLRTELPRVDASMRAAVTKVEGEVLQDGATYGAIDELFLYHGWAYVDMLVLPRTTLSLHGDAARLRLSGENHISTVPFFDMAGYYPIRLLRIAGEGTAFVPGIQASHEGRRRSSERFGEISLGISGSLRGFDVRADHSFLKRRYTVYPFFTYDSLSGDLVDIRGVFARVAGTVEYQVRRLGVSLQVSQYLPIWSHDRTEDERTWPAVDAPPGPAPPLLERLHGIGVRLTARFRMR